MARSRAVGVGAFVIGGVLLFGVGLFLIGKRQMLFEDKVEFFADFSRLGGLQPGALVRVSGRDAGEVLEIYEPSSPKGKFLVKFEALEKLHPIIRTDSTASIQTEGIVGAKFLQIHAGSSEAPKALPGFTLSGIEPISVSDLLEKASSTIRLVNQAIDEARGEFEEIASSVADVAKEARKITHDVRDDVENTAAATSRFMDHADSIARDLNEGRGTIGKLIKDPSLYDSVSATAREVEQAARNARSTSAAVDRIVGDLDSKDVAESIKQTAQNINDTSQAIYEAVSKFSAKTGEKGIADNFGQILANAGEAMSDFAENMEALKRNWFFRGFFKNRGFYDLDEVSLAEYKDGRFAKGKERHRFWLEQPEMFNIGAGGSESLSDPGKQRLERIMGDMLHVAMSSPIMIEGYSTEGTVLDQFECSRKRAAIVRRYMIERFRLDPDYVGVMPMGKVERQGDGVAVVMFATR